MVNELHWSIGTIVYLVRPSGGMTYFLHSVLSVLPSPRWNVEQLSENDLLKILENRKAIDAPECGVLLRSNKDEDEEGSSSTPTCFSDLIPNDLVCVIYYYHHFVLPLTWFFRIHVTNPITSSALWLLCTTSLLYCISILRACERTTTCYDNLCVRKPLTYIA